MRPEIESKQEKDVDETADMNETWDGNYSVIRLIFIWVYSWMINTEITELFLSMFRDSTSVFNFFVTHSICELVSVSKTHHMTDLAEKISHAG